MQPSDKTNFLLEVSPEVYSEIKRLLLDEDADSIVLHYSPYWKEFSQIKVIEKDWMPENAFMLATPPNKKEEV